MSIDTLYWLLVDVLPENYSILFIYDDIFNKCFNMSLINIVIIFLTNQLQMDRGIFLQSFMIYQTGDIIVRVVLPRPTKK